MNSQHDYNRRNKKNSPITDKLATLPLELTNRFKDIKDRKSTLKMSILKISR